MTAATHSLRVSRVIRADCDTLFRAWTDPRELTHWWRQEGDGWAFAGASVDLRVGGAYRLGMTGPDGQTHVARGVYREVERPRRLVFTWGWAGGGHTLPPGASVVEVTLAPDGDGTLLRLVHRGVPAAARGRSGDGWTHSLSRLALAAAGSDPVPGR